MIEFLVEYGMFLAKSTTVVLLVLLTFGGALSLYTRLRMKVVGREHLVVKKLNAKYEDMSLAMKAVILSKKEFKQSLKDLKAKHKNDQQKSSDGDRKRVFVLKFKGDVQASEVTSLREAITAVLTVASASDEVVLLLESVGGVVHGYGLAASQLKRIRDKGIILTVVVDKVAASGGYMMACVADRIVAAPFAIIGSIGVIGQIPNFNRLLKNLDIDYEQMTAGEYKRTLSIFGENTEKGRRKAQEVLNDTHKLFKEFVIENRPKVDIEMIATGEHWYGKRALDLNLVDELCTSDDYLCASALDADLFEVIYMRRKRMLDKLISTAASIPYLVRSGVI